MKSIKKNVIHKFIIFFIAIAAIFSITIGIRHYKKAQFNDCISKMQVEEVYLIAIRYYYENEYDLGGITRDPIVATIKDEDLIKEFLTSFKKQSFIYSRETDNRSYSTGENIKLEIVFHNKTSMAFDIRRYKNTNKILVWVYSDYLHDISSIYKLPYTTGADFFDWIVKQII